MPFDPKCPNCGKLNPDKTGRFPFFCNCPKEDRHARAGREIALRAVEEFRQNLPELD